MKPIYLSLCLLACWMATIQQARAAFVQITDKSAFQADGFIDWSHVAGAPAIQIKQPFTIPVDDIADLFVTVSQDGGNFQRMDQDTIPRSPSARWRGNFAPDEILLWTLRPGPVTDPLEDTAVTFAFSDPIAGIGLQFQPAGGVPQDFTAILRAYDSDGNLLGDFSADGLSTRDADDSAVFLAVLGDTANISIVQVDVRIDGGIAESGFSISGPWIQTAGSAGSDLPENVAVPEPPTIVLLVFAGLGTAGYCGWRRRIRPLFPS